MQYHMRSKQTSRHRIMLGKVARQALWTRLPDQEEPAPQAAANTTSLLLSLTQQVSTWDP